MKWDHLNQIGLKTIQIDPKLSKGHYFSDDLVNIKWITNYIILGNGTTGYGTTPEIKSRNVLNQAINGERVEDMPIGNGKF